MSGHSETDVLVIGAGAGGAAVGKRLSDAGIAVVCLEQGPWMHKMAHAHFYDSWETERHRVWNWAPNVRKLPQDYPTTGNTLPMMMNGVGGSTLHYAGAWPRFKPVDFRRGTEHGLEGNVRRSTRGGGHIRRMPARSPRGRPWRSTERWSGPPAGEARCSRHR